MKKLVNVLGQLFGFLTILLYAFIFLDALVGGFGLDQAIMDILLIVKTYAIFVVCGLAGLEFVAGKKLFAFIYFIILAFVVIFSFFPDVAEQITSMIG
ncbi:hypothetical protein ACAG96_01370 [Candidatus Izemoplasma sp. B36]|uniref:hypothetical protein n=1 Tax=Candidatus Izemoplasma sp. B36 TaxID=3242468 RepID=UPI0035575D99